MGTFSEFLRAVFRHWKREVLGGVLIGAIALFSELSGIAVPPRIYEVTAALLIFYAVFLAWSDEHAKAERPEKEKSERNKEPLLAGLMRPVLPETRAMERLAEEMRYQRNRIENRYSPAQISRIGALLDTGRNLLAERLLTNEDFLRWENEAEIWRNQLIGLLHGSHAVVLKLPMNLTQATAGHDGALNRSHGNMRSRILLDLEKVTKITEQNV